MPGGASRTSPAPWPRPSKTRAESRKQALRREILRVASALIEAHGYRSARMRDIAREARISYQTLYNHFPAKSAILEALLAERRRTPSPAGHRVTATAAGCCTSLRSTILEAYDVASGRDRELWREVALDALTGACNEHTVFALLDPGGPERIFATIRATHKAGALGLERDPEGLAQLLCRVIDANLAQFLFQPALSRREALHALSRELSLVLRPDLHEELTLTRGA